MSCVATPRGPFADRLRAVGGDGIVAAPSPRRDGVRIQCQAGDTGARRKRWTKLPLFGFDDQCMIADRQ